MLTPTCKPEVGECSLKNLQPRSEPQDSHHETAVTAIGESKMVNTKSTGGPTVEEKRSMLTVSVKGTPKGTVIVRRRLQQPLQTQTSNGEASEALAKSITEKKSGQCSNEILDVIGANAV